MVKRDTIQRFTTVITKDEIGGDIATLMPAEIVDAQVSISSSLGEMTQYGVKEQLIIHVATNIKLDEYINSRYMYSNKLFKLMRQVKQGNEYFSTLVEVNQ